MFYQLKRHPLPVQAWFRHSLVLTYAFPRNLLQPLLPPGLELATVYSIALSARARHPDLGGRFAALLNGPAARDLRERGGFNAT